MKGSEYDEWYNYPTLIAFFVWVNQRQRRENVRTEQRDTQIYIQNYRKGRKIRLQRAPYKYYHRINIIILCLGRCLTRVMTDRSILFVRTVTTALFRQIKITPRRNFVFYEMKRSFPPGQETCIHLNPHVPTCPLTLWPRSNEIVPDRKS